MPKIRAEWPDVAVDANNLSQYRRACDSSEEGLPIQYPHVLVSPMHLTMMTEPEFPLRMLGAVHLRNHTIRYRTIEPTERLDLSAGLAETRFVLRGLKSSSTLP